MRPLRFAIWLALAFALLSLLFILYAFVSFLFVQHTVAGWSSLVAVIAILGAAQLLVLGIIGDYVGAHPARDAQAPELHRGGDGKRSRERCVKAGRTRGHRHAVSATSGTSSVTTLKSASVQGPNEVTIATSVASRPRAIRMRPRRGTLLRGSKICQRPPR